MIDQVQGTLVNVDNGSAYVQMDGGLTYQILLPSFTAARLAASAGSPVTFFTLHYLESHNQGATMIPRLAGFVSPHDRKFFELFTTCKGIGNRKALRAMALDIPQIAAAIADRDVATLQSLPEIGRRTAETIIATLHGKVEPFLTATTIRVGVTPDAAAAPQSSMAREALEVLLTLGETRTQALTWIDEAMRDDKDKPDNVEALIAKVYRIKSGG